MTYFIESITRCRVQCIIPFKWPRKVFAKSHECVCLFVHRRGKFAGEISRTQNIVSWQSKSFSLVGFVHVCVSGSIFQNCERDQYESIVELMLPLNSCFTCTIFMWSLWFKIAITAEFIHTLKKINPNPARISQQALQTEWVFFLFQKTKSWTIT